MFLITSDGKELTYSISSNKKHCTLMVWFVFFPPSLLILLMRTEEYWASEMVLMYFQSCGFKKYINIYVRTVRHIQKWFKPICLTIRLCTNLQKICFHSAITKLQNPSTRFPSGYDVTYGKFCFNKIYSLLVIWQLIKYLIQYFF